MKMGKKHLYAYEFDYVPDCKLGTFRSEITMTIKKSPAK